MKVLLDESVPRALGYELPGHFVRTVQTMGWSGLANGKLLSTMCEAGFEVLLTCDQNISYQQGPGLPVALLVATPSQTLASAANSGIAFTRSYIGVKSGAVLSNSSWKLSMTK